jgi:Fe-S-cluster-containing hydrogenase component 2
MSYKVIEDSCTNCAACDAECAVDAIIEKNNKRWIDAEKCIDCGACVGVCPAEAIVGG